MPPTGWVPIRDDAPHDAHTLPYGAFSRADGRTRIGVAIGDLVLDVTGLAAAEASEYADLLAGPSLNPFLAAGPSAWDGVRGWIVDRLSDSAYRARVEPYLLPLDETRAQLPFDVADFVDFYASEQHASNLGAILRPNEPPLMPNWKHLPVGYHGRAGTVVCSGTPIHRPQGQHAPRESGGPSYGPATRLDFETEVGFVVGVPTELGDRVAVDDLTEHVFGLVVVNDWSARDLQGWEYRPLGPFLAKSFATSVSPWVVPMAALDAARVPSPHQDPEPLPYLRGTGDFGLDLDLEVRINGQVVSRPAYRGMYWTPGQMLAHLTTNGARLRTGDLYASGTVSGDRPDQRGSLVELAWNGTVPLTLDDGTTRTFLEDGDVVTIAATAPGPSGVRLRLGEVTGRVLPAR